MTADFSPAAHQALVDVHVHFHPGFDERRFFRSALANFSDAAALLGIDGAWTGVLVLTEGREDRVFEHFLTLASGAQGGELVFQATDEKTSLTVRDESESGEGLARLVVVAGRQVRTAEDLEVLAFPSLVPLPDGSSLDETISRILDIDAIPILPWGLGKWSGRRGRLIATFLEEVQRGGVFLADTGHRPGGTPIPPLLLHGEALSIPVLAGSDPLPLPGEDRRPGSCCFLLSTGEMHRTPAVSLRRALGVLSESPPRSARPPSLPRFVYAQLAMQLRKRLRRGRR
jgi:hypothetical protein